MEEEKAAYRHRQTLQREINESIIKVDSDLFKKTYEEKQELKKAKRIYNANMRGYYGNDWKKKGVHNIPVSVDVKPDVRKRREKKYVMKETANQ